MSRRKSAKKKSRITSAKVLEMEMSEDTFDEPGNFYLGDYSSEERSHRGDPYEFYGCSNPERYGQDAEASLSNQERLQQRDDSDAALITSVWAGVNHRRALLQTRPDWSHPKRPFSLAAFSLRSGETPTAQDEALAIRLSEMLREPVYVMEAHPSEVERCIVHEYRNMVEGDVSREMPWDEVPYLLRDVGLGHNDICDPCYQEEIDLSESKGASPRRMMRHSIEYENDVMVLSNAVRRIPSVYHYGIDIVSCSNPLCCAPIAIVYVSSSSFDGDVSACVPAARMMGIPLVVLAERVQASGHRAMTVQRFDSSSEPAYREAPTWTGSKEEVSDLLHDFSIGHSDVCGRPKPRSLLSSVGIRRGWSSTSWGNLRRQ